MKITELWAKAKVTKGLNKSSTSSKLQQPEREKTQIILKENKNNALIKCWNCGKEIWVKKGSPCFDEGLCFNCIDD